MFIIQTRKENAVREAFEISSSGNADDWRNEPKEYGDFKNAKKECEALIEGGQHKAGNVRIVKIACTFQSEIKIKATLPK